MADPQFPNYRKMIVDTLLWRHKEGGSTIEEITKFISLIRVTDDPDFVERKVMRYLKEGIEMGLIVLTNNSTKLALVLPKNESASSMERLTRPVYSQMTFEAIKYLKENGGAYFSAIIKYITDVYGVSDNLDLVKSQVKFYLKKGVEIGLFVTVIKSEEMAVRSPEKAEKSPEKPDAAEPNAG